MKFLFIEFSPEKTSDSAYVWWIRSLIMQSPIIKGLGLQLYGRTFFDLSVFITKEPEDPDDPAVQEKKIKEQNEALKKNSEEIVNSQQEVQNSTEEQLKQNSEINQKSTSSVEQHDLNSGSDTEQTTFIDNQEAKEN